MRRWQAPPPLVRDVSHKICDVGPMGERGEGIREREGGGGGGRNGATGGRAACHTAKCPGGKEVSVIMQPVGLVDRTSPGGNE
jgi:hypothetical protein